MNEFRFVVNINVTSDYSFHLGCYRTREEAEKKGAAKSVALYLEGNEDITFEIHED